MPEKRVLIKNKQNTCVLNIKNEIYLKEKGNARSKSRSLHLIN